MVAVARRHQEVAHLSGIVAGLWLDVNSVSPGMAVDGVGRSILVPSSKEIHPPPDPLIEVWIAHLEEDRRLNRVVESYEILFETPGRYNPVRPDEHPMKAVFLGVLGEKVFNAGRVYAGVVGASIVAASGQARLLLGPEVPGDIRLFSVGTPDATTGEYRDHLAVDSTGTIRFHDAVSVATKALYGVAVVTAGYRPVEFQTEDVLDPVGLWNAPDGLFTKPPGDMPAGDRLCTLLVQSLNKAIADAEPNQASELEQRVRKRSTGLRPQTVRLLMARDFQSPRADARRLARLLLEDAFPDSLGRLPEEFDGPLGVGFVGLRPLPTAALPGSIYLVAADKTGTQRELRFEVPFPGKDNDPERYRVAVGTVANLDPKQSKFDPVLTADSSGIVTIYGDLRVYPTGPNHDKANGLIVQVTKPASPNDPPEKAGPFGLVSPSDLAIQGVTVTRTAAGIELTDTSLLNTGDASITHVQLHATVFGTNLTVGVQPESTPLVRNIVIDAKQKTLMVDPDDKTKPLLIRIDQAKLQSKTVPVTLVLSVYGYGPGFVPVSAQRTFLLESKS